MTRNSSNTKPNQLSMKLAMQIAGYIRNKNLAVDTHLTEQTFVDAFHISRSPVRKAMALLQELGIVRSEKNRGYFLQKTGKALDRVAAESAPANGDAVYPGVEARHVCHDGTEVMDIELPAPAVGRSWGSIVVRSSGNPECRYPVIYRIDSRRELEYLRHRGVLRYIVQRALGTSGRD